MFRTMFAKYLLHPLLAPADSGSGAGDVQEFGESGDVAILEEGANEESTDESDDEAEDKSDTEDDEEKKKSDTDDETPEEDEEETDDKEKEEDTEEKDDEEVDSSTKPSLKAITAKYPKIFKEFPQLKDAYFRADAYAEVFPSVDDAKEAAAKAETLDGFEQTLVNNGSSLELFNSIKDSSPAALGKFVDNLLPTLFKFDTNLFYRATEPITRQLLYSALQHGKKTGDKNLAAATQHLSNYLFGDAEVKVPASNSRSDKDDPEREAFEQEKRNFENERRSEFLTTLNNRAGKQLISSITDGLDPKGTMTDFMRTTITEKVMDEIGKRLENDSRHMDRMRSLHARAAKAGFPKAMTDQIASAYLSAAKLLVPVVRSEIKQKALAGKVEKKQIPNRQVGSGGNSGRSQNLSKISPKQVDWSKTSDEDFLNDRVTMRK